MTSEPDWLTPEDAILFHGEIIAAHGGADGVRDAGLLHSAVGRPRHLFAYESQDLCVLAGAYAHGIAKNHPFIDGNKRVAFVMARVFLMLNGVHFDPPEAESVVMIEGLASGVIKETEFVAWLRKYAK